MTILQAFSNWIPPSSWRQIETVDMHTGGEPLRVIVSGLPVFPEGDVLSKRRWFAEHCDEIRTALMWEPRGHADMYGAIMTPSRTADFDVFFLHNEGYSTMCGHAMIALTKLAIETGLVTSGHGPISFEAPCGRIVAEGHVSDGVVVKSTFRNVPSYVALEGGHLDIPAVGKIRFDLAYGGAYYAIVEAAQLGLSLDPSDLPRLVNQAARIKSAIAEAFPVTHPMSPELSFLYGVIFTDVAKDRRHHSRNVCVFANGEVDRSATGSGVSARAALHVAKGEQRIGEEIVIESIIGTIMAVRAIEPVSFGGFPAIIPEVGGSAYFTGRSTFFVDPTDPLRAGFILR